MCIFFRGGSHARLLGARRETPIEKKVACEAERAHLAAHRSAPPGAGGAGASVGRMPKESLTELLMFADQIKKITWCPKQFFFGCQTTSGTVLAHTSCVPLPLSSFLNMHKCCRVKRPLEKSHHKRAHSMTYLFSCPIHFSARHTNILRLV